MKPGTTRLSLANQKLTTRLEKHKDNMDLIILFVPDKHKYSQEVMSLYRGSGGRLYYKNATNSNSGSDKSCLMRITVTG